MPVRALCGNCTHNQMFSHSLSIKKIIVEAWIRLMYDAVWLISLLTHCPWVHVRNGHKRKKKSHTLSLSFSLSYTHTHTHTPKRNWQCNITVFVSSNSTTAVRCCKPKNRERGQWTWRSRSHLITRALILQVAVILTKFALIREKIASFQHPVLRNAMTRKLFFLVISLLNPSVASASLRSLLKSRNWKSVIRDFVF